MALRINLLFSASAEQLFDAWTKRDLVEDWLFKNDTNTICANIDLRPGGKLSIQENDGGEMINHLGEYAVVHKPDRLAFTLHVPTRFKGESRVSVQFKPTDVGTEMLFIQVGVKAEIVAESWNTMFQNLTLLLLDRAHLS